MLAYRERYDLALSPKGDKTTVLSIGSPGTPYSQNNPIRDILKSAPHKLSKSELASIDPPLGDDSNAHIEKLQGKQALCLQKSDKEQCRYYVEFNHNPDGTEPMVPAYISFTAKPAQYKRYIKQIKECLQSIKWIDQIGIK